jgi:hypothetical protein
MHSLMTQHGTSPNPVPSKLLCSQHSKLCMGVSCMQYKLWQPSLTRLHMHGLDGGRCVCFQPLFLCLLC